MALSITSKTALATYHHARQSDLEPTRDELRAWVELLNLNYQRVLPEEMTSRGLNPNEPEQADLVLLLSELTEGSGFRAKAMRGAAVVAGLRSGGVLADSTALLASESVDMTALANRVRLLEERAVTSEGSSPLGSEVRPRTQGRRKRLGVEKRSRG